MVAIRVYADVEEDAFDDFLYYWHLANSGIELTNDFLGEPWMNWVCD